MSQSYLWYKLQCWMDPQSHDIYRLECRGRVTFSYTQSCSNCPCTKKIDETRDCSAFNLPIVLCHGVTKKTIYHFVHTSS